MLAWYIKQSVAYSFVDDSQMTYGGVIVEHDVRQNVRRKEDTWVHQGQNSLFL